MARPTDEVIDASRPSSRSVGHGNRTLELVSETVADEVNVDAVHDLLAVLLVRYHAGCVAAGGEAV